MTSDTHEADLDSKAIDRAEIIDRAIKHIGHAIAVRRSLLAIRQADLSDRTGIQSTQISRVESGVTNARLSTIIVLLDELGLLSGVLDALPADGDTPGHRVISSNTSDVAEKAIKPLSTSQFMALYDYDPSVEAPVASRAGLEIRKRGFAVRRVESPTLGTISYATAIANAKYSENVYFTEEGQVGGFKHLSVVIAGRAMSAELIDSAPILIDNIKELINNTIEGLKLRIVSLTIDTEATAHVVKLKDEIIESAYIYDKICDVINAGAWLHDQ